MKIQSLNSKIWWLSVADEIRPERGVPVVEAVKKFAEAFQFAAAPNQLPAATEGYRFSEGAIIVRDTKLAIKEISLFNDGLSVEVYSHSDDAKAVLDKVLEFLRGLGYREPHSIPRTPIHSNVIFDLERDINPLISDFDPLSKLISEILGVPAVELRAFDFSVDPKSAPPFTPTNFKIERRQDVPFSENRYFSYANTSTQNHLRLIEAIEARLTK
jgi:hypothetical protein